jgi:lipopolysaccharide/colanic/teichoic acid biosynthesis glycosyltransferase/glycosyltransferase involved in cell wall biosynthesis
MLETIALASCAAVAYHHAAYPLLLRLLAGNQTHTPPANAEPPSVAILVPAFQEARRITEKLRNLAALDYPLDKFKIIVLCDGCTDSTAELARTQALAFESQNVSVEIVEHADNRGKVAVLNEAIAAADAQIVILTDVSSRVAPDALKKLTAWFADPDIGIACGRYQIAPNAQPGERAYWAYQNAIKDLEAAVAAPMGVNGAFYALRRSLWTPLPSDAINDDFVLPMRIVANGARIALDPSVEIEELDASNHGQDLRRRIRLGAGNLQQIVMCRRLLNPLRPRLAFVFASGKALRGLMPFALLFALLTSAALALQGEAVGFALLAPQAIGYGLALIGAIAPRTRFVVFKHAVEGYAAAGYGAALWLLGRKISWGRTDPLDERYVSRSAAFAKRSLDICAALGALAVTAVLFVPIALAIKLDSRGPLFYRQMRVGERTPRSTKLFYLIKFRTMRTDAEKKSDPVWSSAQDPRITRVGRFMRKTRLDELPQCINVLRGEMSVVGPRPERPAFFNKLEAEIPFYVERTYGLKPGITGLAQVTLGYDADIEDVRNKVLHDHAYALRIDSFWSCLSQDISIIFRTIAVMALGKGR